MDAASASPVNRPRFSGAWFCRGVLGEADDGTVIVVLELDGWIAAAGTV
jgi:hypothetical protein